MKKRKDFISFEGLGHINIKYQNYTESVGKKILKKLGEPTSFSSKDLISFLLEKKIIKYDKKGKLIFSKAKKIVIKDGVDTIDESIMPEAETIIQKGGVIDGALKGDTIIWEGGKAKRFEALKHTIFRGEINQKATVDGPLLIDASNGIGTKGDILVLGKTEMKDFAYNNGRLHSHGDLELSGSASLNKGSETRVTVNNNPDGSKSGNAKFTDQANNSGILNVEYGNLELNLKSTLSEDSKTTVSGKTTFKDESQHMGYLTTGGLDFYEGFTLPEKSITEFSKPVELKGIITEGTIKPMYADDFSKPFITFSQHSVLRDKSDTTASVIRIGGNTEVLSKNFHPSILEICDQAILKKGSCTKAETVILSGFNTESIDGKVDIDLNFNAPYGGEIGKNAKIDVAGTTTLNNGVVNKGEITTANLNVDKEMNTIDGNIQNIGTITVKENAIINNLSNLGTQSCPATLNIWKNLTSEAGFSNESNGIINIGNPKSPSGETFLKNASIYGKINCITPQKLTITDTIIGSNYSPGVVINNGKGDTVLKGFTTFKNGALTTSYLKLNDVIETFPNSRIVVRNSATIKNGDTPSQTQMLNGELIIEHTGDSVPNNTDLVVGENVKLGGKITANQSNAVFTNAQLTGELNIKFAKFNNSKIEKGAVIQNKSSADKILPCTSVELLSNSQSNGAIQTENLILKNSTLAKDSTTKVHSGLAQIVNGQLEGTLLVTKPYAGDNRLQIYGTSKLGKDSNTTVESVTELSGPIKPQDGDTITCDGKLTTYELVVQNALLGKDSDVAVTHNATLNSGSVTQSKKLNIENVLERNAGSVLDKGSITTTRYDRKDPGASIIGDAKLTVKYPSRPSFKGNIASPVKNHPLKYSQYGLRI